MRRRFLGRCQGIRKRLSLSSDSICLASSTISTGAFRRASFLPYFSQILQDDRCAHRGERIRETMTRTDLRPEKGLGVDCILWNDFAISVLIMARRFGT